MVCVLQDGRLLHKDVPVIWKEYPKELHEWLLRLTEVFDLPFPLENQKINIVPSLLPQREPQVTCQGNYINYKYIQRTLKCDRDLLN